MRTITVKVSDRAVIDTLRYLLVQWEQRKFKASSITIDDEVNL